MEKVSGRENLDQVMWLINQMAEKPKRRKNIGYTIYRHIVLHTYEAFVGKAALAGIVRVSEREGIINRKKIE